MAAGTFPINLRDIRFVLFEQLGIERLCHFDPFKDFSREIFEMVLEEAAKLAREVLAPLNAISDREGCAFDGGRVRVPRGFHEAYRRYCAGGWIAATVEADAGGQGLPETVGMAAAEMFAGACCSFTTYPGLTRGAANLIRSFGTEEQKRLYLEKMLSGRWTGTMCLTEPQAGSSLGDVKTTAKREGNSYILTGTKIFITGGDQDLTENIIHTVLARTEGAPPGSRGLSLFIVPKIRVRPDGSLGEANDVVCSGLEHKMGIKGSSTAILVFGGEGGCRG
ncbi:MAG: acyl-CoA dehydrogenase family protein, partial [Deltaproteobacteria bacterium]|nr:acyl-CoA dehydrogenase family protein [Deltaproteobacteria bacterium]